MKYLFDQAFYDDHVHLIPAGATALTDQQYQVLATAKDYGMIVGLADGKEVIQWTSTGRSAVIAKLQTAIDRDTDRKILTGFEFEGKNFYLSIETQINLKGECDLRHTLTYPVTVKAIEGFYQVSSPAKYLELYSAIRSYIRTTLELGWIAKAEIAALTDQELWRMLNAGPDA